MYDTLIIPDDYQPALCQWPTCLCSDDEPLCIPVDCAMPAEPDRSGRVVAFATGLAIVALTAVAVLA